MNKCPRNGILGHQAPDMASWFRVVASQNMLFWAQAKEANIVASLSWLASLAKVDHISTTFAGYCSSRVWWHSPTTDEFFWFRFCRFWGATRKYTRHFKQS